MEGEARSLDKESMCVFSGIPNILDGTEWPPSTWALSQGGAGPALDLNSPDLLGIPLVPEREVFQQFGSQTFSEHGLFSQKWVRELFQKLMSQCGRQTRAAR